MTREDVASQEELYYIWYLEELLEAGYIQSFKYQPKPFILSDVITFEWDKKLKTKTKVQTKVLMQGHEYQADFLIFWTEKALNLFFTSSESRSDLKAHPYIAEKGKYFYRSIIDVKGTFNQNDAWRRFSIEQKWVWQRYHVFVQKIIPEKIFKETFTPEKYLACNKVDKPRKINYKPVRSLKEFVQSTNLDFRSQHSN
jgi:hypothetical protein